jgi:4,5-DOPA dioxygenase extradiol
MPVIFAAHGAPTLLDDTSWVAEVAAWAQALPEPKAVLMIAAHWEHYAPVVGAAGAATPAQ